MEVRRCHVSRKTWRQEVEKDGGTEGERCVNTAVSVKHLRFFISSPLRPSSADSPVGLEGGIMFGELAPGLHGAAPSNEICDRAAPAISNCCHHLFIFPFPSPYVCLQRRPVQVSLTSASRGEDEEEVLSALIVLGPQLIAANPPSCHACSAPQCFILRRDTC